ncbi:cytochrome [Streptomyces sp. MNU77]|uniref:cytochrome P450 n=1 Tax=Streptomyces sp. MNU77 TaxID=1573406 RepID=UPI0005DBB5D5|nr:cytochrome P450 [Streptomyces sp. MNU77]OLO25844.1 cytochrome [Streptomyces sp. MNU77]
MEQAPLVGTSSPTAPESEAERVSHYSAYQPWLQENPVPYWNELRDHAPVTWSEEFGGYWILTRYADIEWAARNPDVFSSANPLIPHRDLFDEKQIPLQLDGEEHRLWRVTLADLFSPGAVNHFTPGIREAAADAVGKMAAQGGGDFVKDLAVRLPAETFLITFGVDRSALRDLLDYKDWFVREGLPRATSGAEIAEARRPLQEFFRKQIRLRRAEGTEGRRDVLSRLLESTFDGRPLTEDEMVNATFVTMMASLDTTTSALGLMFLYLAEHPDAQALITRSPERIPQIAEELIRHEPVLTTARLVTRDVERHGVTLRKGDHVLMSWGMSGLDPDAFDDPGAVDFDRRAIRQLAFGTGPHRCLGMHLARRIIHIALQEWHFRIPRYALAPGSTPVHHYSAVRGLSRLELTAV